jgi:ABC-type dipeptide/oligopeptide/nickel transport system permease component
VGLVVVSVATVVGVLAGLAAGYLRGWVDRVISGVVDILLGFPYLILAIGLMAMMGPGLLNIVLALAYKEWLAGSGAAIRRSALPAVASARLPVPHAVRLRDRAVPAGGAGNEGVRRAHGRLPLFPAALNPGKLPGQVQGG